MSSIENNDSTLATPNMEVVSSKFKILALHGYRQSGTSFRLKTGSLRKLLQKVAQFTYVSAPHPVVNLITNNDSNTEPNSEGAEEYGWWFNRDDHTFRGARDGGPAIGFQETVEYIESIFEKHGPFDGILGFSQGACLAGLLCHLKAKGLTKIDFSFAIFASGFKSDSLPHRKLYGDPINIPSLHIYGEADNIIPKEMSIALKEHFEGDYDPAVIVHPGGHFLPASSAQKAAFIHFFNQVKLIKSVTGL